LAKDFSTLEFLGNAGSVSLPLTMALGLEKNLRSAMRKLRCSELGPG